MFYLHTTPWWLRMLYPGCTWELPAKDKTIYLSFDDGPHPAITPFVLDTLAQYGAKATFFCIGKNVVAYPQVYQRVLDEGHTIGNHTYDHLRGWDTKDEVYLDNVAKAAAYIDSNLFRPPYGKATRFQLKLLRGNRFQLKPVMWSVLSGDFDVKISAEKCLRNVTRNSRPGSIIVFHDSEKAFERLRIALPAAMNFFSEKGYRFEKIVL